MPFADLKVIEVEKVFYQRMNKCLLPGSREQEAKAGELIEQRRWKLWFTQLIDSNRRARFAYGKSIKCDDKNFKRHSVLDDEGCRGQKLLKRFFFSSEAEAFNYTGA